MESDENKSFSSDTAEWSSGHENEGTSAQLSERMLEHDRSLMVGRPPEVLSSTAQSQIQEGSVQTPLHYIVTDIGFDTPFPTTDQPEIREPGQYFGGETSFVNIPTVPFVQDLLISGVETSRSSSDPDYETCASGSQVYPQQASFSLRQADDRTQSSVLSIMSESRPNITDISAMASAGQLAILNPPFTPSEEPVSLPVESSVSGTIGGRESAVAEMTSSDSRIETTKETQDPEVDPLELLMEVIKEDERGGQTVTEDLQLGNVPVIDLEAVKETSADRATLRAASEAIGSSAESSGNVPIAGPSGITDSATSTQPYIFRCSHCPKRCTSFQALKIHNQVHSYWKCVSCVLKFRTIYDLEKHIKSDHYSKYNRFCRICGTFFESQAEREEHTKTHGGEVHSCGKCGQAHKTKEEQRQHMFIHNIAKCEDCEKSFTTETSVIHHKCSVYKCDKCEMKFTVKRDHEKHMSDHLKNTCEMCGLSLKNKRLLTYHTVIKHSPMSFLCVWCGKGFSYKSSLDSHILTHEHKSYQCATCGVKFDSIPKLYAHIVSAHNFPYFCRKCGRAFSDKKSHDEHSVVHAEK